MKRHNNHDQGPIEVSSYKQPPLFIIPAILASIINYPDSKAHGANMGPIWGRQDPGGPHVGPMSFAIWITKPTLRWWHI